MTTRERLRVLSDDTSGADGAGDSGAHPAPAKPVVRARKPAAAGQRRLVVDKSRQTLGPTRLRAVEIGKMVGGLIGALLIPAAVFVVADEAFESRFFLVREVEVTGLKQVDRMAVERAAGLEHPRSVLTLRAEEMRANIETLPWVKSAAVDVSLHGRVAIAVQEAELAGVVSAGELYLMDSGGEPIRRWTPQTASQARSSSASTNRAREASASTAPPGSARAGCCSPSKAANSASGSRSQRCRPRRATPSACCSRRERRSVSATTACPSVSRG